MADETDTNAAETAEAEQSKAEEIVAGFQEDRREAAEAEEVEDAPAEKPDEAGASTQDDEEVEDSADEPDADDAEEDEEAAGDADASAGKGGETEVDEFLRLVSGEGATPPVEAKKPDAPPPPEPKAGSQAAPAGTITPELIQNVRDELGDGIADVLVNMEKANAALRADIAAMHGASQQAEARRVLAAANAQITEALATPEARARYGQPGKMTAAQAAERKALIEDAALFSLQRQRLNRPISDEEAIRIALDARLESGPAQKIRSTVKRRARQVDIAARGGRGGGSAGSEQARAESLVRDFFSSNSGRREAAAQPAATTL